MSNSDEFDRESIPDWLSDVAWRVDNLVRQPPVMRRFREMVTRWNEKREQEFGVQKEWQRRRKSDFLSPTDHVGRTVISTPCDTRIFHELSAVVHP